MKLRKILPVIGLILFIYLIYKVGLIKIINSFSGIKVFYLILALLIIPFYILISTFKWSLILKKQGIYINLLYLIKLNLIGNFYGTITPARVGSLIRAYYLKNKIKKPFGECASSIVIERVIDLTVIFLFTILGCLLLINYFSAKILLNILIAFLVFIGLFIFFINKRRSEFIFKLIYTFFIPQKFKSKIKDSFDSFYSNIPKFNKLIIPFLLTIIIWIIVYLTNYFVARALSINVPVFYFIPLYAFATIISIIPITISGLGTRELTLVSLFSIFNILPEKIMAMSILGMVVGLLPVILGFILSLKIKGKEDEIFTNSASSTG